MGSALKYIFHDVVLISILRLGGNNCMKEFDDFFDYDSFLQAPTMGERYTIDEQCQNVIGRRSYKCVSKCGCIMILRA